MIDDRFLPRVWTDEGYYYPIFSELGITYENKNLPFTKENIKDINWAFRWRFNENMDMEYINTIEQCTGLRDKNGKLIFEGDLLDNISIDEQYEVRWDEDTARFCCITDNEIYDFDNFDVTAFEVIGNIHENADLLNVGGK